MFKTTEIQENVRKNIRQLAEDEIKPIAYQLDISNEFPHEAIKKLGHIGYMGIPFPKEYGGIELDYLSYVIAVEELARVDAGSASILSAHTSLASYPIFCYGTEEQKKKYLLPMARGEKLGAFALTEPNAGSDAGGMETSAMLENGSYLLNGHKIYTTNAPLADVYIVFAVTKQDVGTSGVTAFILEKDMPGIIFGEQYDKMGIRSSVTAEINFVDVVIPKANRLGAEGEGFKIALDSLNGGRIGIAAQALGIAQGAYENALEHAKTRHQFGKPICQQQGVSFKLADMATKIQASRLMVYSAASRKEDGANHRLEAAMAKQYASDVCLEVVNDAVQIFGGSGYLKGMDVERAYRDAKITTLYEGTNEIQRTIIATQLLGEAVKPKPVSRQKTKFSETGERKNIILEGTPEQQVESLLEALVYEGYDFTVGIPLDMPIGQADRVVSVGKGIGDKENMLLIKEFAEAVGCAIGTSRPLAESLKYVPLSRYIGISGQAFHGNLYIACGISGASQHLAGIKEATTIVAINSNKNARIFKNCDYGIVGELEVLLPLLAKVFTTKGPKKPAPPMVKMKRVPVKRATRDYHLYICSGCAFEYDKEKGDLASEVPAGTDFHRLPEDWICPECGDSQEHFLEL